MRLIELYAEEFGCFTDRRFRFGEGLNLIEGPNESGKSTVMALIRFLFYGFPRRGGEEGEERYKRISRKGHRAAGSVTFICRGEEYYLYRDYILHTAGGREMPAERVSVTAADGRAVELGGKTPGEYFFGLPSELFCTSICVRQSELHGVADPATGNTVGELLFFGEGGARLETAAKILDAARRDLQHTRGRGGKIAELEDEEAALDTALGQARERAERLRVLRNDTARYTAIAQDKAREVSRHEDMLCAARLDAELARFDAWHTAKQKEAVALASWQESEAAKESEILPPESFVTDARELLRRHAVAEGAAQLRQGELAAAKTEVLKRPVSPEAYYVTESGGAAAIERRARRFVSRKRRNLILSIVFFLLCGAALGASFLLPTHQKTLWLAGGAALLLSLFTLLRRKRAKKRERRFYERLGLRSPAMLRTFLVQYQKDFEAREQATARAQECEALFAEAKECEAAAFAALGAAFAAVGAGEACTSHAAAEQFLQALADREAALRTAHIEERMRYENAKSAATALGGGLAPAREQELRAKRAALPTPEFPLAELERRLAFLQEARRGIGEKLIATEREEAALRAGFVDPAALQEQKQTVSATLAESRRKLAAVTMAREALREADDTLRHSLMPRLARLASALFERLTGGAYQALTVSEQFSISVVTREGSLPLSHFSMGCRDAAHFALRVALSDLIAKEPLPLLLDEVTAHLDDTRTSHLLSLLESFCREGGQCLLFSCHSREAALLAGHGFTHITLA